MILGTWECARDSCAYLHTTKPPTMVFRSRITSCWGQDLNGGQGSRPSGRKQCDPYSALASPSPLPYFFSPLLIIIFFFFAFLPCFCPFLAPHFVFCSFSFLHLSNDFISFSPIPSPLLTQNTWITHYFKLLVVFFEWAWCFLVLDFEWQAEHNI